MSYIGFNPETGELIKNIEVVKRSIREILKTLIGTRVMRRDFGCLLPLYVDRPLNNDTKILIITETLKAIDRWEKRVTITRVNPIYDDLENGKISLDVDFKYIPTQENSTLREVIQ